MREIVHGWVSLYFYVASVPSISTVGFSSSDSFVGVEGNNSVSSVASFDKYFGIVWEVFELEFRYFSSLFLDEFCGSAEEWFGWLQDFEHYWLQLIITNKPIVRMRKMFTLWKDDSWTNGYRSFAEILSHFPKEKFIHFWFLFYFFLPSWSFVFLNSFQDVLEVVKRKYSCTFVDDPQGKIIHFHIDFWC